jgi:replicative DNA helicase
VASIATEQTAEVETDRIDSINTGIPLREISHSKDWQPGDERIQKLMDANKFIDERWKYFLNVRRDMSTESVAAWLRGIINKYGELDVCYIDLFDKLTDVNVEYKSDALIGSKLGYLNQVAEELNIHICLLVQIHRAAVKDTKGDHRPKIHNLKGGGAYEEVARLILLLHREKYYNHKVVDDVIEFNVGKQNNGPSGDDIVANLLFQKETVSIIERPESVPNIY